MGQSSRKPEESSDDLSFARRLRRARMARKWGQMGLAERMYKVGLDYGGSATVTSLKGMISKWERGKKAIGQDNLHLLAETLGMPVEELGAWVDPDFVWQKTVVERSAHRPTDAPSDENDRGV